MAADDIALDGDGRQLSYSPAEVRAVVRKMLDEGKIMAVVVDDGQKIGVQVFGPPSRELADVLQQAAQAYRRALRGN